MRIATPAFFCFPFAQNIFFHPLSFNLYVSLDPKWVSCRQHIYMGHIFSIHSARLCLLVGAFNPFTFKVIIVIYVPIAIFLMVWGWFVDLFSSVVFLDYISPFNIFCKVGLMVLNSLNLCLSEKFFISPSTLNEILTGYSNLGCWFFLFSTLKIFCPSLLACRVSAERSAVKHMGFPLYVTCCFSLAAFNILSLCLVLFSLISMCLGIFLLGFILYGALHLLDLIDYFLFHVGEIFNYNLFKIFSCLLFFSSSSAAAKSLQLCSSLCDPTDSSPPDSPIPGILQARTLEWVAISFSNAWKWKVKVKSLSRVRPFATPWTAAYQSPLSMGFSRQEYWSGVPLSSPLLLGPPIIRRFVCLILSQRSLRLSSVLSILFTLFCSSEAEYGYFHHFIFQLTDRSSASDIMLLIASEYF